MKTTFLRMLPFLFALLCVLSFSPLAQAHSEHKAVPAFISCLQDTCDGGLPNNMGAGGLKCTQNITLIGSLYMQNHSGRLVGEFDFYISNNCSGVWSTFKQIVSNAQNVEISGTYQNTTRETSDDFHTEAIQYSGPFGTSTFQDNFMLGFDTHDCYNPYVQWNDYANIRITTSYPNYICP